MTTVALTVIAVCVTFFPIADAKYLRDGQDRAEVPASVQVPVPASVRKRTTPGDFDLYVLSMSYQPEFCHQHKYDGYPGCEHPRDFWRSSLTLHGLWPEDNDGYWPSGCTTEQFNHQTVDDIGRDKFEQFWPNVKAAKNSDAHYSFWKHEWEKHGTCSGLSQDDYFATALEHFLPTPIAVHEMYGSKISKMDLLAAYAAELEDSDDEGGIVLVCAGGKYLSEVRTCVGRNKDGSGSQRIACIQAVVDEGNCGDEIFITKFYSDDDDDDGSGIESMTSMDVKLE
eukprot:CAMPEP_0197245806 /NCGR_PEP_ID=MMETSP1429-20130617/10474_1 /TAXON_ID=49237 /ORGANISM="Chaetoceros  sp., Strain UNC1202" /LENGTH=282 /DNA_ID=CAMNT_0042706363 /DNA_START=80 /DNA_END=928 /DNA_ORIENTATION=+